MRIVLDVNILVRADDRGAGLARDLLRVLLRQAWTVLISGEMLIELARALRYPRLQTKDQVPAYRNRHLRLRPVFAGGCGISRAGYLACGADPRRR